MTRFLRKIRQNLFTENRVTKYLIYAIGEIFLVVVGILIALSVNNWNEWKNERKIEKGLLIELRDNLERNIDLIDTASAKVNEINKTTNTIIEIIEEKNLYSDTIINYFGELLRSGSYLLRLNTNGYESLRNTGFEILSSKIIKNEILMLFETTYPSYIKTTEVTNAIWESNTGWWQDYFYIRPSKPGLVPLNFNSLKEDKKFINMVRTLENGRDGILDNMKMCKAETQRVLQLIKDELNQQ